MPLCRRCKGGESRYPMRESRVGSHSFLEYNRSMRITKPSLYVRRIQLGITRFFQKWMANRKTVQRVYQAESSRFPLRQFGVIKIYGTDNFVLRVSASLESLKKSYAFGYSLVQRYIHAVIESDVTYVMGCGIGVWYERTAPSSPFAAGPARYASYMVRRAIGERQSLGFAVRSSSRALAAVLRREMHAMELLGCDFAYVRSIRAKIQQLESSPSFKYSKQVKRRRWAPRQCSRSF